MIAQAGGQVSRAVRAFRRPGAFSLLSAANRPVHATRCCCGQSATQWVVSLVAWMPLSVNCTN